MMESSSNITDSFIASFGEDEIVVLREEYEGEATVATETEAISANDKDESAMTRSLPTDYVSRFYQSMRRPVAAMVPTKKEGTAENPLLGEEGPDAGNDTLPPALPLVVPPCSPPTPSEIVVPTSDLFLLEPATKLRIDLVNDGDDDLSTVASQTIIASPGGSCQESRLGDSLLSLKVDDVPDDLWNDMELEEEEGEELPVFGAQSKLDNLSGDDVSPSETVGQGAVERGTTWEGAPQEQSAASSGELDTNAYAAVGKALLHSTVEADRNETTSIWKGMTTRRVVVQIGCAVLLVLLLWTGTMLGDKRVGPGQQGGSETGTVLESTRDVLDAVTLASVSVNDLIAIELEVNHTAMRTPEGGTNEQVGIADEEDLIIGNVSNNEGFAGPRYSSLLSSSRGSTRINQGSQFFSQNDDSTQPLAVNATAADVQCRVPFDSIFGPQLCEQEVFGDRPGNHPILTFCIHASCFILLLSTVICLALYPGMRPARAEVDLVEEVEPTATATGPALVAETGVLGPINLKCYSDLRKLGLQRHLRARKCKVSGTKGELIQRLLDDYRGELDCLSYRKLQHKLKERGLKQTGKKEELVRRLLEAGPWP